ncbi:MAG: ATP-dependent helicase [Chloracidobacterium sp.]|nr:ATP-dependent helicase [Chloracidobacterium sp.]
MKKDELIAIQKQERIDCGLAIVNSTAQKKIIVAGAGTGKTYTFGEVLKANGTNNNLAMTFINMLAKDMEKSFGNIAEVKTFHAYCKRILHAQNGQVNLIPYLTKIIEEDANALGLPLSDFNEKFQLLDESSAEIEFYLKRGDYYDAVSFDDSVYRLFKLLQNKPDVLPKFEQIVIDEFQDFNPLEVAFIKELEQKGNILIVGDDDQAVYDRRNASPVHLRELCDSGKYEVFELPYCSRCTQVVVDATNAIIERAEKDGHLVGRRTKRYECYIPTKDADSTKYPKIIAAKTKVGKGVAKYVDSVIGSVSPEEIAESWVEGEEYPTILIVGSKQYLNLVYKELSGKYPQMAIRTSQDIGYSTIDGYDLLLNDAASNLGWRILAALLIDAKTLRVVIEKSQDGTLIRDLLEKDFVQKQERVLEFIRTLAESPEVDNAVEAEIRLILDEQYDGILENYIPDIEEEVVEPDKTQPSILLTSFVGCKGLSAGKVVIVGANNGSFPRDPNNIKDVEIAQLVVALTRTRKECHIITNEWLIAPKIKDVWQPRYSQSIFFSWIPKDFFTFVG